MTTKTTIIVGETFEISTPYVAGHVLTEGEAYHLNQLRCENIRNNCAKAIKEAKEANDPEKLAAAKALVATKNAEYVFRVGGQAGDAAPKLDPIERAARKIAKDYVVAELAKTGRKIGTPPEGETAESWKAKMEANIDRVAANEKVISIAKKQVAAAAKARAELSDSLGLDAA